MNAIVAYVSHGNSHMRTRTVVPASSIARRERSCVNEMHRYTNSAAHPAVDSR